MTFTFHKGKHRAKPLYWLRWWPILWGSAPVVRKIRFSFDSRYNLGDVDQLDINKLFGVAHGWIHRHSARFGGHYDLAKKQWVLHMYVHRGDELVKTQLCTVPNNHWYTCEIIPRKGEYMFRVVNENKDVIALEFCSRKKGWWLALLLGPYFGGNEKAPNQFTIEMKKL